MARSNQKVVPEAKEALEKFKYEVASEVGVNLKQGYNGDISSKNCLIGSLYDLYSSRIFLHAAGSDNV